MRSFGKWTPWIPFLLFNQIFSQDYMVKTLRSLVKNQLRFREEINHGNMPILNEYDFIIVGSGPSGSAVASRLSEIKNWNILLIEAGDEETILHDIPFISTLFLLTNYSYNYMTEKQENICLGINDKTCTWSSGRGIGGGSIMNGMVYTRGFKSDYDDWAIENKGWSYFDVLPYFLKSERMTILDLKFSPYHSTTGTVNIEYPFTSSISDIFVQAMIETGLDHIDYNNPNTPIGVSKSQATMKKRRRCSAATAYLFPVKRRRNFHIVKNAMVTRVIIDPKTKVATGVEFIKNGFKRIVHARNEVVLSAGALNSPKILMLSGIGHEDHLNQVGIPVIKHLPVGDGLQDHLSTIAVNFLINTTDSFTLNKFVSNAIPYYLNWLNHGDGPLGSNGLESFGVISAINSSKPEVELMFVPTAESAFTLRHTMGIGVEAYSSLSKLNKKEGFAIWPVGLYPESRGKVRLKSNNPMDQPKLTSNFLNNQRDVKVIVEGIKFALRLVETESFRKVGAKIFNKPLKGCEDQIYGSDAYYECVLRTIPVKLHHHCCTARMGNDEISVVDSSLKVYGVKGLRVVDTSIMPKLIGGHPMAAAYMIGEKAADMIKSDWYS